MPFRTSFIEIYFYRTPKERQPGFHSGCLGDRGLRHRDAPQCRLASKVRQNAGLSLATRLLFSQVAYLVHDNLDVLTFNTVLVGPCVRVELTCEEDFLSLLEEIPRDDLLVLVELLLEDDATEEACLFAVLGEVLRECEACESLSFVRCHVGCKSAGKLDVVT